MESLADTLILDEDGVCDPALRESLSTDCAASSFPSETTPVPADTLSSRRKLPYTSTAERVERTPPQTRRDSSPSRGSNRTGTSDPARNPSPLSPGSPRRGSRSTPDRAKRRSRLWPTPAPLRRYRSSRPGRPPGSPSPPRSGSRRASRVRPRPARRRREWPPNGAHRTETVDYR